MPLGPVVPTLPPPGRGPFGARRDSRRPAAHPGAGAPSGSAMRQPAPSRWRVSCSAPRSRQAAAPGAGAVRRRAARSRAVRRARCDDLGTPARRPGLHGCDRLLRRAQRRRDPATVKRIAVSTGPIAVLGPLALLSLFLLPGSLARRATGERTVRGIASRERCVAAMRLLDRASAAPGRVSYRGVQFVSAWTTKGSTGLVVDVVHRPGYRHDRDVAGDRVDAGRADPSGGGQCRAFAAGRCLHADPARQPLLAVRRRLRLGRRSRGRGRRRDPPGRDAGRPPASGSTARAVSCCAARSTTSPAASPAPARSSRSPSTRTADYSDAAESAQDTDRPKAWPDAIDPTALQRMRDRGWKCPDALPPSLQLVDARRGGGHYDGIVHLSYSDGLASVSVFEQRGRLRASDLKDYRATTVAAARSTCATAYPSGWSGRPTARSTRWWPTHRRVR